MTSNQFLFELKQFNLSTNPRLERIQQKLVHYYSKVHPVRTIKKSGYDVDCIAFEEQPALIDKSVDIIKEAKTLMQNRDRSLLDDSQFDFKFIECPTDSVAIVRPRLSHFGEKNINAFSKLGIPTNDGSIVNYANYRYITSPWYDVKPSIINEVSVTLGLGNEVDSNPPYVSSGGSHSLNQMWWMGEGGNNTYSLEAGWIQCDYWSLCSSTSLFVFSTTDNYQGNDDDQYNNMGGFISYPNTPALGTPVSSIQYKFSYNILPNHAGFGLTLTSYDNYTFGKSIDIGYYTMHRYQEEPSFNFFQVGAEICLDPLDAKAQASGKIYDYSISGTNIKFKTFSESNPADPYKFSYFQQSWSNNDLQRDAVNFFGGEKGISCESTLIEIIGGTLGGLLLIGSISYLFYYGRSHGWCAGSNVDQNADYTIIEG